MFVLPELRVFRGSILQVLLVLAVMWEDTASIGNILGLCTADILSHYGQLFIVGPLFILIIYFILRALAALSIYSQYSPKFDVKYTEVSICAHCCVPANECCSPVFDPKNRSSASCIRKGLAVHCQTIYTVRKLCDYWGESCWDTNTQIPGTQQAVCITDGSVSAIYICCFCIQPLRSRV